MATSEALRKATIARDIQLKRGYRVDGRWQVMRKLGQGSFGAVYKVLDAEDKICGPKACKVESRLSTGPVLKMEVAVLTAMQGTSHICKLYACGKNQKHIFMTITLLGPSIATLMNQCARKRFSLPTTMMIAIQCLQAIKDLHSVGWLHRDVKVSNFAIGQYDTAAKRTVFMFDFGLSRRLFNTDDNTFRQPRAVCGFRGTYRYCSINAHKHKDLGRHDDLISLMYMMIEMLTGDLPWSRLRDDDVIEWKTRGKTGFDETQYSDKVTVTQRSAVSFHEKMLIKKEKCAETLYDGLPDCFVDLHQHLHSLLYEDTPPYDSFENAIYTAFPKSKMNDLPFDWEEIPSTCEEARETQMCPTQSPTEIAALSDKPHDGEEVNDNIDEPMEGTMENQMCPTQSATVERAVLSDKPHDDQKVNDNVEPMNL